MTPLPWKSILPFHLHFYKLIQRILRLNPYLHIYKPNKFKLVADLISKTEIPTKYLTLLEMAQFLNDL